VLCKRIFTIESGAWTIIEGEGPLVAAAIHDGSLVRSELAAQVALGEADRLREEDPYTGEWTALESPAGDLQAHRIIGRHSRFEVDLNRPREKCVYLTPGDAWGLQVWKTPLSEQALQRSLAIHDQFYSAVKELLDGLVSLYSRVVVYDLHTYNHRRSGPGSDPEDPVKNPEVNLGTGTMDRTLWHKVVERFLADLSQYEFLGRRLDVRENVKFQGGHFPKWIHQQFPQSVCVLSIEMKKFFMDEWTGKRNMQCSQAIHSALRSTVPGVLGELRNL